jgi:hypothetical protein
MVAEARGERCEICPVYCDRTQDRAGSSLTMSIQGAGEKERPHASFPAPRCANYDHEKKETSEIIDRDEATLSRFHRMLRPLWAPTASESPRLPGLDRLDRLTLLRGTETANSSTLTCLDTVSTDEHGVAALFASLQSTSTPGSGPDCSQHTELSIRAPTCAGYATQHTRVATSAWNPSNYSMFQCDAQDHHSNMKNPSLLRGKADEPFFLSRSKRYCPKIVLMGRYSTMSKVQYHH